MNLIIHWTSPVPYPSSGFQIYYRRNYDFDYTTINTSGTTSGNTYLVSVVAPACYEGYIHSWCGLENFSDDVLFGTNAYQPLNVTVTVQISPLKFIAHVTSAYPNPYAQDIIVSFNATTTSGTTSMTQATNYPAGSTSADLILPIAPLTSATTISSAYISAITPIFDNGGQLQQLDLVDTPPYFAFYDGTTSGVTWLGSPLTLPSFILQGFNVTAVDTDGNPLAGNILVSWITNQVYGNAVSPYNEVIFSVYDPDRSFMGSAIYAPATLGLQYAVIPIVKTTANIDTSTEFTMTTQWGDLSTSATVIFYLPDF